MTSPATGPGTYPAAGVPAGAATAAAGGGEKWGFSLRNTLAFTGLSSLALTSWWAANNWHSAEHINIPMGSSTTPFYASAPRVPGTASESTTSAPTTPPATLTKTVIIKAATPAENTTKQMRIQMVDAPTFTLPKQGTNETVIENRGGVKSFVASLADSVRNRKAVIDCTTTGTSSDEQRLDSTGGIGQADARNLPLAKQYGRIGNSFFSGLMQAQPQTANVQIHQAAAHEVILDKASVQQFQQIRKAAGFKTNVEMIQTWKTQSQRLSEKARDFLATHLAHYRGTLISCDIHIPGTAAVTAQVPVETAPTPSPSPAPSTTATTTETVAAIAGYKHHREWIPLMLFGLPLPGRKRRSGTTGTAGAVPPRRLSPTSVWYGVRGIPVGTRRSRSATAAGTGVRYRHIRTVGHWSGNAYRWTGTTYRRIRGR